MDATTVESDGQLTAMARGYISRVLARLEPAVTAPNKGLAARAVRDCQWLMAGRDSWPDCPVSAGAVLADALLAQADEYAARLHLALGADRQGRRPAMPIYPCEDGRGEGNVITPPWRPAG